MRREIERWWRSEDFLWATGIEDTYIVEPHGPERRILDEYELTDHYRRYREDISLLASLGVAYARYGIPWYRISPSPGKWEWGFADEALGLLIDRGVAPILDLVHYGTPRWLEGAFAHPDFPHHMAEYGARAAERYRGQVRWYTPLNEPRVTAWYTGRLGWWPPNLRSEAGFLRVLVACAEGIQRTHHAILGAAPDALLAHVDATDLYLTQDPDLEPLAANRQEKVFLALDLVQGLVDERHPLWHELLRSGVSSSRLEAFRERPAQPDLLGLNMYPMFTVKHIVRTPSGPRTRMRYGDASLVTRLCEMYFERYRLPLFIAETATKGPVNRRIGWLEDSLESVTQLRSKGVPVLGYTWWPMFALVAWAYRQGSKPVSEYLIQMGLWDLEPGTLNRVETPVVQAYRDCVAGGLQRVGRLRVERAT